MPASPSHALGLDVGGTKIAAGLVEIDTGVIVTRRREPTRAERSGEDVLSSTMELARSLLQDAADSGLAVSAIGVGVAELVDPNGHVTSGHTIAWEGVAVRERLAALAPTVVDADVRAAARAEARFGAGRRVEPFLFVSVGTGIASCLVVGGRPYAGAHGNAHVLATQPSTTGGLSLEAVASGPGLVRAYHARTGRHLQDAREVIHSAADGDAAALAVVHAGADALGTALAHLVNVLDPAALVIGGGLGCAPGAYWERLVPATRAGIWAPASRGLPIVHAELGPDAALVGAALATEAIARPGGPHHEFAG